MPFGNFQVIRNFLNQRFYHSAPFLINKHLCTIYDVSSPVLGTLNTLMHRIGITTLWYNYRHIFRVKTLRQRWVKSVV